MLQHYSVSWKKDWLPLLTWLLLGLAAAIKREWLQSGIRRTFEQPTAACRCHNHTVIMLVQINGRFTSPTTLVTVLCLKMAPTDTNRCLWVYATPKAFYEALKEAGGTPGENMTMDNKETTHVTGSKLDISVNWQGAAKRIPSMK